MSRPLAPAAPGQLTSGFRPAATGTKLALAGLSRQMDKGAWLMRVARQGAWAKARPTLRPDPLWGRALGPATAGEEEAPAPAPEPRRKARRRAAPQAPAAQTAKTPPAAEGQRRPQPTAPKADQVALVRNLPEKAVPQRLTTVAGDLPIPEVVAKQALPQRTPPAIPMAKAKDRTPPAPPAQSVEKWRASVADRAHTRLAKPSTSEKATQPWSTSLDGPTCALPDAPDLATAPSADRAKPDQPTPERREAPANAPGAPAQTPDARPEQPRVETAETTPTHPSKPPANQGANPYIPDTARREQESDALFETLLGGGPAASARPPASTPEPDVAQPTLPLPTNTPPTPGLAVDRAVAAGAREQILSRDEVPPLDLAKAIGRVLRDEARRHGIDVDGES